MKGLILVGWNHKSAPAAVRGTLALVDASKVLDHFKEVGTSQTVAVSTCNRFELYFTGDGDKGADWAMEKLEDLANASLQKHAFILEGGAAIRHLMEVVAGLDSLVIGETQILAQVKDAYQLSTNAGLVKKQFNVLFQRALYVGKRVRTKTGISVGQTSVAAVGVQLAETIFGGLEERKVLILGAGEMAELTARHLQGRKVQNLTVLNRTASKAEELARVMGGKAMPWDALDEALIQADIVISSTGARGAVLTEPMVAAAMQARQGKSLFIIDIAMPHDAEDAVHDIDNVYLYRIEDLEGIVAENLKSRVSEVEHARSIVNAKAAELERWADSVDQGQEESLKHSDRPGRKRRRPEGDSK